MRFAAFLISLCNATQVAEKLTKKKERENTHEPLLHT